MTGLEQTNSKVTVHFSAQESEAFDLCIGADGIHSNVREAVVLYQVDLSGAILALEESLMMSILKMNM